MRLLLGLLVSLCFAAPSKAQPSHCASPPISSTGFVYPVGDPRLQPVSGSLVPNGYNNYQDFNIGVPLHTGVDLANGLEGGLVRATYLGTVVDVHTDNDPQAHPHRNGWGNMVRLRHLLPDGETVVYSQYAHMQVGSLCVDVGDTVEIGEVRVLFFELQIGQLRFTDTFNDGSAQLPPTSAFFCNFFDASLNCVESGGALILRELDGAATVERFGITFLEDDATLNRVVQVRTAHDECVANNDFTNAKSVRSDLFLRLCAAAAAADYHYDGNEADPGVASSA